jgi:hypothetical protein
MMYKKILCIIAAVTILISLSPVQIQAISKPANCVKTSLSPYWTCQINFVAGWNLISLPLVPVANTTFPNTVDGIFGSNAQHGLLSNVTSVSTYAIVAGKGTWQACAVSKVSPYKCTGTLKNMVDGQGYWVYVKVAFTSNTASNANPTYGGLVGSVIPPAASPPAYSLIAGWNLVGYKPQPDPTVTKTLGQYLSSLNTTGSATNYDQTNVWIYDNVAATWIRSDPALPTIQVPPGVAMWIFMNTADTLYP